MKNSEKSLVVRSTYKPLIVMDPEVLEQARYFVKEVKYECQWFHQVERIQDGFNIYYHVKGIYIPNQSVTGTTVDTAASAMVTLGHEVRDKVGGYGPEFNEIFQSLTCWCHSHVNMNTSPSGTDNTQFNEQIASGRASVPDRPQMMMIFNKRDEFFSRVFDPELNLLFEGVPMSVGAPADMTYIKDALKNKITHRPTVITSSSIGSHYTGQRNLGRDSSASGWGGGSQGMRGKTGVQAKGHVPSPDKNKSSKKGNPQATSTKKEEGAQASLAQTTQAVGRPHPTDDQYFVDTYNLSSLTEDNATEIITHLTDLSDEPDPTKLSKRLTEIVQGAFTPYETCIITELVFGDLDSCLDLAELWTKVEDDTTYSDAYEDIQQKFEGYEVEEPTRFLDAVVLMRKISDSRITESEIEKLIQDWFEDASYYPLSDEEDKAFLEELNSAGVVEGKSLESYSSYSSQKALL